MAQTERQTEGVVDITYTENADGTYMAWFGGNKAESVAVMLMKAFQWDFPVRGGSAKIGGLVQYEWKSKVTPTAKDGGYFIRLKNKSRITDAAFQLSQKGWEFITFTVSDGVRRERWIKFLNKHNEGKSDSAKQREKERSNVYSTYDEDDYGGYWD